MRPRAGRSRSRRRGGAILEFSLIMLVLVPLFLGLTGFGLNMLRSLAVIQLARDAGHMFARGADLSQPGNKTILVKLGDDVGLTNSAATSNAVVILSAVTYIDKPKCAADGRVDAAGEPLGCTNYAKWAFTRRIVVGDPALRSSNLGSPLQSGPSPVVVDSAGRISLHDQVTNSGDVAVFTGINPYAVTNGNVSGLPSGQILYIAEAASEGIAVPPFVPKTAMYSFNMF
jgi:hypothetical protein